MKRLRPECGSAFRVALEAAGRRSEDPLLTHRLHAVLLLFNVVLNFNKQFFK